MSSSAISSAQQQELLEWAAAQRRDLPWRRSREPWQVLVSEVMLQQTQVDRVIPKYTEFLRRWPEPGALAAASLTEVLGAWQGLGYPRRARNLHAAAQILVDVHHGEVPPDLDDLLALPGVGAYTARAVLVFAFGEDRGVVDTNVGRLLARWRNRPLRPAEAQALADQIVPTGSGWEWNQGLFDLGAAVCVKRAPMCTECPAVAWCRWRDAGGDDPAVGSGFVSRSQPRFEGSDRQIRGQILAALQQAPASRHQLAEKLGVSDGARFDRIARSLLDDRLVTERDSLLWLGDAVADRGTPDDP